MLLPFLHINLLKSVIISPLCSLWFEVQVTMGTQLHQSNHWCCWVTQGHSGTLEHRHLWLCWEPPTNVLFTLSVKMSVQYVHTAQYTHFVYLNYTGKNFFVCSVSLLDLLNCSIDCSSSTHHNGLQGRGRENVCQSVADLWLGLNA